MSLLFMILLLFKTKHNCINTFNLYLLETILIWGNRIYCTRTDSHSNRSLWADSAGVVYQEPWCNRTIIHSNKIALLMHDDSEFYDTKLRNSRSSGSDVECSNTANSTSTPSMTNNTTSVQLDLRDKLLNNEDEEDAVEEDNLCFNGPSLKEEGVSTKCPIR